MGRACVGERPEKGGLLGISRSQFMAPVDLFITTSSDGFSRSDRYIIYTTKYHSSLDLCFYQWF